MENVKFNIKNCKYIYVMSSLGLFGFMQMV